MKNRIDELCVYLLLIVSAFVPAGRQARAADATSNVPSIDQVVAAWNARPQAVDSLEVTWRENVGLEPGSRSGREQRSKADDGSLFPNKATSHSLESRFILQDDWWRYDVKGSQWNSMAENFSTNSSVNAFDGQDFRRYSGVSTPTNDLHDLGFIMPPETSTSTASFPQIAPVLISARPFSPRYGHFENELWKIQPDVRAARVRGLDCFALRFAAVSEPTVIKSCWVGPAPQYLPIRVTVGDRIKLDIEYDSTSDVSWFPSKWTLTILSPSLSTIEETTTFEVTSLKINPQLAQSDFSFSFPPGTEIVDHRPQSRRKSR